MTEKINELNQSKNSDLTLAEENKILKKLIEKTRNLYYKMKKNREGYEINRNNNKQ